MITYDRMNKNVIKVILYGRLAGKIKGKSGKGWQYFPLNSKTGGDVFDTIREVKDSLEGE